MYTELVPKNYQPIKIQNEILITDWMEWVMPLRP